MSFKLLYDTVYFDRGEMVLFHGDELETIAGDSQYENTADHCTGQMFEMLTGKLLCFHVVYPNTRNSERHGYFPLSGPFEMKVLMIKKDSILVNYNWILVYTPAQEKSEWTDKLAINFLAPGSVLQRNVVSVIHLNRKTLDISVTTTSPEFSLSASADFRRKYHRNQLIFSLLSANCTVQSNLLYGITLQYDAKVLAIDDNQHPKHSLIEAHFNVIRPGLSLDIAYTHETEGSALLDMHRKIKQTSVYYCSKDHPVMYQLHINPELASRNGDITKVDFVVDINMKYVSWNPVLWTNVDKFQLTYPGKINLSLGGQNIYVENDMTANFQDANRTTTITYLSQKKQEKILMTSHVSNNSKDNRDMNFTYHMDLLHGDKYTIFLDGRFIKHARDVALNLDVTYNKVSQQTNRENMSSSVIVLEPKQDFDPAMEDRAKPNIWDNLKHSMTLDFYAKAVPVFSEDDKTKPTGVGVEWSFNISYPLPMGQKQYMSAGNFGKHFHNSIENFKYWFEGNEKTVIHTMTPSNATTVPSTERSLMLHLHREKRKCFAYKFKLKTSLMKISHMILYDRQKIEEEGTSQIHVKLYIDSAVPFFNYNHEVIDGHNSCYKEILTATYWHRVIKDLDKQFKHMLRIDHIYGYVNLDTIFDTSRPIFHATQAGNMSLHLFGFNLSGDISNVYQWQHQGLPKFTLKWRYADESTRILVVQLRNPKLLEAIVSYCSNLGANPVWELLLEMETITPTSIQYVFKWNPEKTGKLTALWQKSLEKLGGIINHIADTIEGNLKLPLMERVVPFTGLAINDIMKKIYLTLQHGTSTQQLHLKALLQKSNSSGVSPDKQEAQSWGLPKEGLVKILHIMLEKIIQFDAALATYRESFPVAEILISMVQGMGKQVSSIAVNLPHYPAIKKIIAECQATFVLPSPLVMNQFVGIPEIHPVCVYYFAALKHILPWIHATESKSALTGSVGLVFAGPDLDANRYVYTFDGSSLRIPARLTRKCTYLLALDLRKRKFAVLLTPQGLTIVTKTDTVTITKSGHVFIKDCPSPLKNEYKSDDGSLQVMLEKENTKLLTNFGIVITCVTKSLEFCAIQLTDTLSRNTTVGLLGTNDGEPVTDRRLPDGNISDISSVFLQNYVISGPDICYTGMDSNQKAQSCVQDWICGDMPKLPQSYKFYKQFQDVCNEYNGYCDTTSDDLCSIVVAYVMRSAMNLMYFNQDHLPALCHNFLIPSTNLTGSDSLDVVVVVNEGVSMLHAGQDTGAYLWNLMGTAWSYLDARVTFVGYGAAGSNQNVHIHMMDRQVFVPNKDLTLTDRSDLDADGSSSPGFQTALQYALHLPFSIYSQRIILLLTTDKELSLKASTYSLREALQSKKAVLYVFSHATKWVPSGALGIDWQGQAIQYSKITPDINIVQLPETEIIQLVKSSRGAMFNMDASIENNQAKVTEILDYILKQTLDRAQEKCQGFMKN
ncbi:hypothetical protein CHS0354_029188 [Potamilus streckersoni]|uniref:VWFD domain-containing protein n=1 Tax=Potamilus streckersoni TaxID=2493646 RepID=A0AAE0TG54_9BIVA|nr:hypothetical protein CHS0354_029188 [Potamilus streckersoni]